jgi:hypothetical protein
MIESQKIKNAYRLLINLEGIDHVGDLGMGRITVLKCILKK